MSRRLLLTLSRKPVMTLGRAALGSDQVPSWPIAHCLRRDH
jgi:hypothetical protein